MDANLLKRVNLFIATHPDSDAEACQLLEELAETVNELEGDVDALKAGVQELENCEAQESGDLADCINAVLDEVERPLGTLHATVPPSPAAERALIKLYDAVGRTL